MSKSLAVWWNTTYVGALQIDQHGDLAFTYAPSWVDDAGKPAISVSLPKQRGTFSRRETRPFFAGLLPDEGQRNAVARALGVSKANDFRLLEKLGGDVAGALTLWPEGEAPPAIGSTKAPTPLSDQRLIEILDALPGRPFLAGDDGVRLSLAGAQQKLPLVQVDGRLALPGPGQPTTHILKPPIPAFPSTMENEALALRLASAVGLATASVEPRRTEDRVYLVIERYDRMMTAEGEIQRLHQEDFCQALGFPPEQKYAAEGGPTFAPCFDLVRRACAQPAVSVLQLLDAAIFNVVIGNADAHAKNYSLLYRPQGVGLAPLYDLLSTVAYPEIHGKFAMKIAKRSTLEQFTPTTWGAFAEQIGMSGPFVRRRAVALAELIGDRIESTADALSKAGFESAALRHIVATIQSRALRLLELGARA